MRNYPRTIVVVVAMVLFLCLGLGIQHLTNKAFADNCSSLGGTVKKGSIWNTNKNNQRIQFCLSSDGKVLDIK